MNTRTYDSFTCVRYAVLTDSPEGDFLDQLGVAKYFLIFSNEETNDKAFWIPSIGFIFIDEDMFEEGFQKVPLMTHASIEDFQFHLIIQEAWCRSEISDLQDTVNNEDLTFEYLEESDSAEDFANSIAIICSTSSNLNIVIDEGINNEILVDDNKIDVDEVFGSYDEDDTWVLVAGD